MNLPSLTLRLVFAPSEGVSQSIDCNGYSLLTDALFLLAHTLTPETWFEREFKYEVFLPKNPKERDGVWKFEERFQNVLLAKMSPCGLPVHFFVSSLPLSTWTTRWKESQSLDARGVSLQPWVVGRRGGVSIHGVCMGCMALWDIRRSEVGNWVTVVSASKGLFQRIHFFVASSMYFDSVFLLPPFLYLLPCSCGNPCFKKKKPPRPPFQLSLLFSFKPFWLSMAVPQKNPPPPLCKKNHFFYIFSPF